MLRFLECRMDEKAGDARAFLGQDVLETLHFPGFSKEACEFLLKERDVAGLGVDTLSLDFGASKDFAVHKLWLGAGKWGLECVANLSKVPPGGAMVFVALRRSSAPRVGQRACWRHGSRSGCRPQSRRMVRRGPLQI